MNNKKIAFLSAFQYVIPADYEAWFEDLAEKGWHPQNVGQWSSIAMTFGKGEATKYRYVFDMQSSVKKDYKLTYEEFGWEFVGQMASSFLWRKQYSGERPESFSDEENLVNRSKRFVWAVSFSFIIMFITAVIITVCFALNFTQLKFGYYVQFLLGLLISYSFTFYLGGVMRKIYKNKNR